MPYRKFFAGGALALACAAPAFASTLGSVTGSVIDGGRPVAGAKVTLRSGRTIASTVTGSDGTFRFPAVPFGDYAIDAERAVRTAQASARVQTDAVVTLRLELGTPREIGSVATTLAKGPAASPVSVNTLDRRQISELPQKRNLDQLVATMPGIVRFSYDEPVAHGFHGLTYEIDGVPVPQGTSANFSAVVDPRSIDSLEISTGAIPAEFGGSRMGAVVNILSWRDSDLDRAQPGSLTAGLGTYAAAETTLTDAARIGERTKLYFSGNLVRTNRRLDSPAFTPLHDASNERNLFLRTVTDLGGHASLAFDYLDNIAKFQVPINTDPNDPNDPVSSPAGTDDVQTEHDRLISLALTKSSADGRAYTRIVPWVRTDRVRYLGDAANDLAGSIRNDDGTTSPLQGLDQDRSSIFEGVRIEHLRMIGAHTLKAGVDESVENFRGNSAVTYLDGNGAVQRFADDASQRGSTTGAYVQDKWTPTRFLSIFGGMRYDRSTGYVSGGQLSPRLEINGRVGEKDVLHGYYGRNYAAPFLEDTRREAVVLAGSSSSSLPVYDLKPERDSLVELGLAHTMTPLSRWTLNFWKRDTTNVLDTTSLAQTPIQAVFNNTVGVARGIEARVEAKNAHGDSAWLSATVSQSLAGGVNGGTFLFCPPGANASCAASSDDLTLQPEDHDQTVAIVADVTKRFGSDRSWYASLSPQYATGYPVEFESGDGRLPPHLTFDFAVGRDAGKGPDGRLGYDLTLLNLLNAKYVLKVNNGFNTTQWGSGFQAVFRVTKPF